MEEQIQGGEAGNQVCRVVKVDNRSLIVKGGCDDHVGSADDDEDLVNKMFGSFSNTLFVSTGKESHHDDHQKLISNDQIQFNSTAIHVAAAAGSSSRVGYVDTAAIKCEDSHHEESCKSTASTFKDRRGSSKRRKTSHSWIRDSPALIEDGHAWRKYGQKVILNAKHPRNYYRCTNKFDQACQATKHVQKIQDDSPLFRTTYYGNHTCRDYLKASELVLDGSSPRDPSKFIRFDQTNLTNKEHPFFSSFTPSVTKEVIIKEEIPSHDHHMMNHSSLCDDPVSTDLTAFDPFQPDDPRSTDLTAFDPFQPDDLVSPDLTAFDPFQPMSAFPSTNISQLEHEDVVYRIMMGSIYDFEYDEF